MLASGRISFPSSSRRTTAKTKSTTNFSHSSFLSFFLCISILISSFFVSSSFGEPKTKKDGKDCIYIGNLYSVGISGTAQAGLAVGLAFEDINNDESILPNYKLCNITKIKDDVAVSPLLPFLSMCSSSPFPFTHQPSFLPQKGCK
jgi:hypothetical protein